MSRSNASRAIESSFVFSLATHSAARGTFRTSAISPKYPPSPTVFTSFFSPLMVL